MKNRLLLSGLAAAAALLASCEKPAAGFTIMGGYRSAAPASTRAANSAAAVPPAPVVPPVAEVRETSAPPSAATITIRPEMPRALYAAPPRPKIEVPPNFDRKRGFVREATVPAGVSLLSRGKQVASSDDAPIGDLAFITDGDKNGEDGSMVDLLPGKQWVQIDLGESREIWLLWIWHFHKQLTIYHDVVAQISDDPSFKTATTVYNNDHDNSSGFGSGQDLAYFETNNGRSMPVAGVKGRYVRFWSRGRDLDNSNQYIEIEVYGK